MNDFRSYKFEGANGVAAFLAVVAGAVQGNCNLPAAENAAGFVGFTTDSLLSTQQYQAVPVARGRCRATAAGAITHGHWVRIANNLGQVEDCQALVDSAPGVASNCYVIGKAENDTVNVGDQLFVTTQEFVAKTAVS